MCNYEVVEWIEMWTNYGNGIGVIGTNRKAIMIWWVAGQVQGDIDLLGKVFWSGKLCVVIGMTRGDVWKWFHWCSVEVVKYNYVSKQEWVYVPWEWIYVVYLLVLPFIWLRDHAGSAYDDYWVVFGLCDMYSGSKNCFNVSWSQYNSIITWEIK